MELYVSNIPLLIYGGTLGELEIYNYFKLNPWEPHIYIYTLLLFRTSFTYWTALFAGYTVCYFTKFIIFPV